MAGGLSQAVLPRAIGGDAGIPASALVGNDVAVQASDGQLGTVPFAQVSQALAAGATLSTGKALEDAQLQSQYGGLGGVAAATGLGAARGLSIGLSDVAASALGGPSATKALRGYQEANPIASTVGELGGAAAPLLLSEGATGLAGAARGAGALPRGISALGGLAGEAAGGLFREGTTLGSRFLQQGAKFAASGAAEGALYGGGQALSESALGDTDLTAEQLFASMGKGALFGGAVGVGQGAVHAAGATGVAAIGRGIDAAQDALGRGVSSLRGLAESAAGHAQNLGETAANSELAQQLSSRFLDGEGKPMAQALSDRAERYANEAAYRSAGFGKKQTQLIEQKFGSTEALGKTIREDAPGLVGKDRFSDLDLNDLKDAGRKGRQKFGKEMGRIIDATTESAENAGALPRAEDLLAPIHELANKLESSTFGATPAVAKLRQLTKEGEKIFGLVDESGRLISGAGEKTVTAGELHRMRTQIDDLINYNKTGELAGYQKQFKQVRTELETRLEGLIEKHAPDAKMIEEYKAAKRKVAAFSELERAAKSGSAAQNSNRFFSLGDRLAGGVGTAIGGLVGGIPGAFIGNQVGGIAGKYARERGGFLLADLLSKEGQVRAIRGASDLLGGSSDMLHKVSQLDAVQAVKSAFQSDMATSVKSALREPAQGVYRAAKSVKARASVGIDEGVKTAKRTLSNVEQVQRQIAAIEGASQSPDVLHQHLQNSLGDLSALPQTTASLAMKGTSAIQYLNAHLPKALPSQPLQLGPTTKGRSPYDPHDVHLFQERLKGVTNPLSVVHDVAKGRATRASVEAVQAVYPKIYAQLVSETLNQLGELKAKGQSPSYDKRLQLGTLLGQPTDWSLEPDAIKMLQSPAAEAVANSNEDGPVKTVPARPLASPSPTDTLTVSQRLETA